MQTRKGSLVESLANVGVGYLLALGSQIAIFAFYGIHFSFQTNVVMGLWFTVISIVRSYTLRRVFSRISRT